jgi:hypothetical protein
MNDLTRTFITPVIVALIILAGVYLWGGFAAFALAALLTILEVTLSFDNAVVNAKVLERMSEVWRKRFLTWGILIAVVMTRFLFPILIVAVSAAQSPWEIAKLALSDSVRYGVLLSHAHYVISSFGGAFLLMVALKYFFDARKDIHWIRSIEEFVSTWGKIEAVEIGATLMVLAIAAFFLPLHASEILFAGIVGIILFIIMRGIATSFSTNAERGAVASGLALFMYLNVLDAAFSLDGVVGAFAITSQIAIIVIGLGIGAYFVRALTLYMVRKNTLGSLRYLEHGAHWAILGLALTMFASLFVRVPEVITGGIGIAFVAAAYYSSVIQRRKAK